jgi:hypothetical protein
MSYISRIMKTKTSILEELDLPEDVVAAYRREALRQRKPLSEVVREQLLKTAREMNAGATASQARTAAVVLG